MAAERTIRIPVTLDRETYRRFAWFDLLYMRKSWVYPALYLLLTVVCAPVALISKKENSNTYGVILAILGIVIAAGYFFSFFSKVNLRANRQSLSARRLVYTVTLTESGICVEGGPPLNERRTLSWEDTKKAFRVRGCIYLYVSPTQAYLLPDGQVEPSGADVWSFLLLYMGWDKCNVKQR